MSRVPDANGPGNAGDAANTTPPDGVLRPAVVDEGFRCPECRYNLTGLAADRCPECGTTLNWDAVRRAAGPAPIAFERARGWRRILAFFITALTVLFLPWKFARQANERVSFWPALFFALVCFASTSIALLVSPDAPDIWAAWMITAAVYIPIQALWLSLLDPAFYRRPKRTLRFWLLIGFYTSAAMLTEVVSGPPMVTINDLVRFVVGLPVEWTPDLYAPTWAALIGWLQAGVWACDLAIIVAVRLRAGGRRVGLIVVGTLLIATSIVVLYSAAVFFIGWPIGAKLLGW
jgi:hypothetical protein